MTPCDIVVEPGCTAEGSRDTHLRLIEAAAKAGATTWKAQWTSNPERMCARRHAEAYRPFYRWLSWPAKWHADFAAACADHGMRYACSVYLPEDVEVVAPHVAFLKIASFENSDTGLLERALAVAPVVISAGQTHQVPEVPLQAAPRVLHCISAYPAPLTQMHLSELRRVMYGAGSGPYPRMVTRVYDGLSDHSRCLITGAVAVGAGARMLEVHYRLDECDPANPDYPVAFSPAELAIYIGNVRLAEVLMGDGVKATLQACEQWGLPYRVTHDEPLRSA